MDTRKLSSVAYVQCGLVLNRKEAHDTETAIEHYKRLNLRSLLDNGHLDMNELDMYSSAEILDEQTLTRADDIIIRLFSPLTPILIRENETGFVIPSQLAVIRLMNDAPVLPGYVRWYLSTTRASNELHLAESSIVQRSITIGALSALQIPVPMLRKQQLIVQIFETNTKRESLYLELMEQETIYMNEIIQKTIGGTVK